MGDRWLFVLIFLELLRLPLPDHWCVLLCCWLLPFHCCYLNYSVVVDDATLRYFVLRAFLSFIHCCYSMTILHLSDTLLFLFDDIDDCHCSMWLLIHSAFVRSSVEFTLLLLLVLRVLFHSYLLHWYYSPDFTIPSNWWCHLGWCLCCCSVVGDLFIVVICSRVADTLYFRS